MNKELHVAAETGGPSPDRSTRDTLQPAALSEASKALHELLKYCDRSYGTLDTKLVREIVTVALRDTPVVAALSEAKPHRSFSEKTMKDHDDLVRGAASHKAWLDLLERFSPKQRRDLAMLMAHNWTISAIEIQTSLNSSGKSDKRYDAEMTVAELFPNGSFKPRASWADRERTCAACSGSGEGLSYGQGPDGYEVHCICKACGGSGVDASTGRSTRDTYEPTTHDLVKELREALGMFAGALPISPKKAWEEALALVVNKSAAPSEAEIKQRTAFAFEAGYKVAQREALAGTERGGWKLVPTNPTQAMCQAGQWKAKEWPKFPLRIVPIYEAMLAAVDPLEVPRALVTEGPTAHAATEVKSEAP